MAGCVSKWPARHLLLGVVAASTDKQLGHLHTSVKRKFEFAFGEAAAAEAWKELEKRGLQCPDRFSLARGKVNLDIAAMALARDRNVQPGVAARQLTFDSSPKGGLEILGCRELVILKGDVNTAIDRMLPIQALGFGLMSVVDKATALIHTIKLEAGPTAHTIRNYCASVHIILTDPGTEQYVPELPDCIDEYMDSKLMGVGLQWLERFVPTSHASLGVASLVALAVTDSLAVHALLCRVGALGPKEWQNSLPPPLYVESLMKTLQEDEAPQQRVEALKHFHGNWANGDSVLSWRF